MLKGSIDTPMINEFMEFYEGLTHNLIPYDSAHERLHGVLPRLPEYLKKLSEGRSQLLGVVEDRMIDACQYAHKRGDWDGFISLSLQGSNLPSDHGDHGLIYVHNAGPFHESVAWLLTREKDESDWVKDERFAVVGPAKVYNTWRDVEGDKPVEQFKSVDEILEYGENLNGKSFLVFPKARIKGLSISKYGIEETPFNIQNWFGDDSLMVSRLPRNHSWDA